MTLEEEIEETKKLIAEAQAKEQAKEGEEFEDEIDNPLEEVEEKPEEKPEVKEEPKPEVLDDSGYARLRREKAAAEKLAREKEQELENLKAQLAAKQQPETEAEAPQLPPELEQIIKKERYNQAGREFNALEEQFRRKAPDYDDVANAYKAALLQSIKIQNPRMTTDELIEKTNEALLVKAGSYVRAGFDPIEELYHEAKELGFKAAPKEQPKEEPKELKPDLSKIAANKARNAGTTGAKGAGERGQITLAAAADMSVQEWASLPAAEKKRILAGG